MFTSCCKFKMMLKEGLDFQLCASSLELDVQFGLDHALQS
jgi:hypothetical protein